MAATPQLRIDSVHQLFNDGNHNAFTDLCRFGGRLYLTFRSCPDGHMVFPTSWIVVMTSDDGGEWREVYRFNAPSRDVRDPHFLVFDDRLFVYTGTWLCDPSRPGHRDMNDHLGYGAWSADGESWHRPQFLEGTYGHYVWRAAASGGKAYLCGRRKRAFALSADPGDGTALTQAALLESEDGLVWRHAGLFTEDHGDETAFLFEADRAILAIHRGAGSRPAQVCRSKPPYQEWTRSDLDRNIGGPLLAKWNDRYLVGGRKTLGPSAPVTTLYWLIDDQLQEIAELPSGGDNSYPGFVETDDRHGLLSYYSSHEGSGTGEAPAAIYLAELSL
jgi:hypothetical protein